MGQWVHFPTRLLSSGPPVSSSPPLLPLSRPLQHAHTDTQTHPLLISKQAEPMKVNNCPLSWKCSLLLRWSGVGVCIQSKHHHTQIPTCGDLEGSAVSAKKNSHSGVCWLGLGFARKVASMLSRVSSIEEGLH